MYSTIPQEWRHNFDVNVTLEELNDTLVILHIPTIVFIIILMVIGILGNILVLWVYTNYKSATNYKSFILWLGWLDLIECVFLKPGLIVSMYYPYMFPSEELCRASRFFHVFISVAAAFIFLAISYERYKKICFMDMHQLSNKRVNLICLGAVVSAGIVAMPALFIFGEAKVQTGVQNITGIECFIDVDYKNSYFPKFYFFFQLLLCLLAFCAMCVFYTRIGHTLKWHRSFVRKYRYEKKPPCNKEQSLKPAPNDRKRSSATNEKLLLDDMNRTYPGEAFSHPDVVNDACADRKGIQAERNGGFSSSVTSVNRLFKTNVQSKPERSDSEIAQNIDTKEITKMLCIVTVVFILAFLPHLILMLINATRPDMIKELSPAGVIVYNIFLRTFVINNMANPIIYYVCLSSFRTLCAKKLKWLFCFCCNKKSENLKGKSIEQF
ncbi:hypothetical protein ACF0H5_022495 [Mactra antiquata]